MQDDTQDNVVAQPEETVEVEVSSTPTEESAEEAPVEEVKEFTFKGKSYKMDEAAYQELVGYEKEMTKTRQELSYYKGAGSQPQPQEAVNPNDPVEIEKRAIERLRNEYGFLTKEELAKIEGDKMLSSEIDKIAAKASEDAKRYDWPKLSLSASEKEKMKDYVINRGIPPEDAYNAIKAAEKIQATQHKGASFEPVHHNAQQGSVKTKSSVESGGYKPMTGNNLKENSRLFWKSLGGK